MDETRRDFMLEIRNLFFSYKSTEPLLDGICLTAKSKDVIWIKGDNGSGKTTLLKVIAHLIEAKGEMKYQDKAINKKDFLGHVAYIPNEPYLFDYLTGEENARFLKGLFASDGKRFANLFNDFVIRLELEEALNKYVQEYSLGMRHKLFWAAMLSRETEILLLDEPFSAFDQSTQQTVEKILKERAEQGTLILFVSHLTHISKRLATRCYKLDSGKIIEKSLDT